MEEDVVFLIVGAHALAAHGVARATGDLDVWIRSDPANADRVWRALAAFGAPLHSLGFEVTDLSKKGMVFQIGIPPRRIDILTSISGVEFEAAWDSRAVHKVEGREMAFLGRKDFLRNKAASGRAKDLADIALLNE